MKKIIVAFSMFVGVNTTYAQSAGMYSGKWEENDRSRHKVAASEANEFAGTDMSFADNKVTFSGLPEMKKAVYAVITNGTGEFVKKKKISALENEIRVSELHAGLYFVFIVYRQQGKRSYVLHVDEHES